MVVTAPSRNVNAGNPIKSELGLMNPNRRHRPKCGPSPGHSLGNGRERIGHRFRSGNHETSARHLRREWPSLDLVGRTLIGAR